MKQNRKLTKVLLMVYLKFVKLLGCNYVREQIFLKLWEQGDLPIKETVFTGESTLMLNCVLSLKKQRNGVHM